MWSYTTFSHSLVMANYIVAAAALECTAVAHLLRGLTFCVDSLLDAEFVTSYRCVLVNSKESANSPLA